MEGGDFTGNDFLFTWSTNNWPYEELRKLIDAFQAGHDVVEPWRCHAHKMVHRGARGYLYKQGDSPRGVFAVAKVDGPAEKRDDVQPGEEEYAVPLRFEILLDPMKRLLVSESDLSHLPAPAHRWHAIGSGVRLEAKVARAIDHIAAREQPRSHGATDDESSPEKRERLAEVYERDQALVDELKRLYKGQCQICSMVPFNGVFGRIVEGHHLDWLCRGGSDSRGNLVLLCPNHHAAVHAADPTFDRVKLEFHFGPKVVPIRLDLHLRQT